MTLIDVMAREREALMTDHLFDQGGALHIAPYSAAPDLDILIRTPSVLRTPHPVRVDELSGAARGRAFIQSCPSLNYKCLWVDVDNGRELMDVAAFRPGL